MSNGDVVEVLNDLLETCYDGLSGFRTAAQRVKSREAIALCESRAQRIDEAAAELYTAIQHLGGHPAEHGHAAAQVHRGWIHLRSHTAMDGDDAVLAEVERGEEMAVRRYGHALSKSLPPDIRDLVSDQARGAEENLQRVRDLRRIVDGG